MEPEQQTTEQEPATTESVEQQSTEQEPTDINLTDYPVDVIMDLNRTEETIVATGNGKVHVIHEITLGDIITSTLLVSILVFMVLDRFIRR